MNHLPSSSLLQSHPARIELARQRFFEEGQAPTGLVGEAVFESWARCLRRRGSPHERATFEPVTTSRTQLALTKNRLLRQAWMDELPRLESVLSTTSCAAMLTDATGVMIGASCVGRSHEKLMPVATRLGVDLSEDAVGTTAPGVAARTGKPVCVLGGEHFFEGVKEMHCAAAPIRDIRGRLAGVLDISSEQIPFEFNAAALVGLYAGAIENRLLVAQSTEHLIIRIQVAPELLDSAMVGLIGLDANGQHAWENGVARNLLGSPVAPGVASLDPSLDRLGRAWPQLASLPAEGAAPLILPNGLTVWARAEMRARDGHRGLVSAGVRNATVVAPPATSAEPASVAAAASEREGSIAHAGAHAGAHASAGAGAPEPTASPAVAATRLRDASLEIIQATLKACDGNVSVAASRLGVSRGLIYRRLRGAAPTPP